MSNINIQMKAHNGTNWDNLFPKTNISQVEGLESQLSNIDAVAKGASNARTFDSVAELDAWLAIPANTAKLKTGDNFYIVDVDVPDYWWDGSQKQKLETEKVNIVNASEEADGLMSKSEYAKLSGIAEGATKVTVPSDIGAASAASVAVLPAVTVGGIAPIAAKTGDLWYDYGN